jgi:phosphohistidine phosphatase
MKILHIVRHAEAVNKNKGLPDFERALVKRGVKGARSVAKRLRQNGYEADAMISSPANRALETAHIFAKELSFPLGKIELHQSIYDDGGAATLLSLVQALPSAVSSALLFGHDPSFSEFARYLLENFDQLMPKGAVVTVRFGTDSWADAGPGNARLVGFDYPISRTEEAR